MEVRYIDKGDALSCVNGKIYVVIAVEKGWYRIIDESGEDYLYPPKSFEIIGGGVDDVSDENFIFTIKDVNNNPGKDLYDEACGLIDTDGYGEKEDYIQGIKLLEESACMGNREAMNNLGMTYYRGYGVEQDYMLALKWFRRGAAYGSDTAYENLALLYRNGHGVPQNKGVARDMYLEMANKGSTDAMNSLGNLYYWGIDGEPDYEQSFQWYSRSAELEDAEGLDEIGGFYKKSLVVEQDYKKAAECFAKAAYLGDKYAFVDLAGMYYHGYCFKQNYANALYYLRKVVPLNMGGAMNNIGTMYADGLGVHKNEDIALAWYKRAVMVGYDEAEENVKDLELKRKAKGLSPMSDDDVLILTTSIFDKIDDELQYADELPKSFTVQTKKSSDELVWEDGAQDGVYVYHNRYPTPDIKPLINAIREISANNYSLAETMLLDFFNDENNVMISCIDEVQTWILTNSDDLDGERIYFFARSLLINTQEKEIVKFAISVLEIMNLQDDDSVIEIVEEMGLSDEFTLFTIYLFSKLKNGNENIFEMAQKVHGWGRIHAVEWLEPTTEEIKDWLLHEGINHIMPEYSGVEVANKIGLVERLQAATPTSREYVELGNILQAVLMGIDGPLRYDAYKHTDEATEHFLAKVVFAPPNEEIYDVLRTIEIHFDDEKNHKYQDYVKRTQEVLSSPECEEYLKGKMKNGKCLWLASQLGIDCSQEIKKAFQENWKENNHLVHFLNNENDILEVAKHFLNNVEEEDIINPPNKLFGGVAITTYENIIKKISGYQSTEEELLLLGLRAPVKRSISVTLSRLHEWKKNDRLTVRLKDALEKWKEITEHKDLLDKYKEL